MLIDVACEAGHAHEVLVERGADNYPVLEPCETCGEPTRRVHGRSSAGHIEPWKDVDGWDIDTGETVRVTCEADRKALEAKVRSKAGCENVVAITQSPVEQRRAFEDAQHRRYEHAKRLGMHIPGLT